VTKRATQRKAVFSTFPENCWTLPAHRLHPTTTNYTTESIRSLSTNTKTARGNTLREVTTNRNHGYVALPQREKSRRHSRGGFFAPRRTATNLKTTWLTILCAAPKKKQEKMSLGDFLGDQCTRNPTRLAHAED
jgi:hypothetical protein